MSGLNGHMRLAHCLSQMSQHCLMQMSQEAVLQMWDGEVLLSLPSFFMVCLRHENTEGQPHPNYALPSSLATGQVMRHPRKQRTMRNTQHIDQISLYECPKPKTCSASCVVLCYGILQFFNMRFASILVDTFKSHRMLGICHLMRMQTDLQNCPLMLHVRTPSKQAGSPCHLSCASLEQ